MSRLQKNSGPKQKELLSPLWPPNYYIINHGTKRSNITGGNSSYFFFFRPSSRSQASSSSSWLSLGAKHQCIHLESIAPSSLGVTELTNISLQISSLPVLPPRDQYMCVYDGHLSLAATKVPGGLVCPSPPFASRPALPASTDHVTINLAVTSSAATKEFISKNIMLFSCDSHSTCLDCVSSLWPCAWCYNKCCNLGSPSNSCREAIVSSKSSQFQLLQNNPSQMVSYGAQY